MKTEVIPGAVERYLLEQERGNHNGKISVIINYGILMFAPMPECFSSKAYKDRILSFMHVV